MSSLNLNKVVLCGRLCADPELKQTQNNVPVVSFTLAVNRRFSSKNDSQSGPQADFISCVAWRSTAEFIARYFRKGSALCLTGSIQTRNWQDAQGQKRYATEVQADEVSFVTSANQNGNAPTVGGAPVADAYTSPYSNPGESTFEEIPNDDSLPF